MYKKTVIMVQDRTRISELGTVSYELRFEVNVKEYVRGSRAEERGRRREEKRERKRIEIN